MHFLLTVLLTASYPFSVYLATILPQVPLDVGVMGTTPYGFERLGFYYVINQKTKYALSANGSDPGQGVVAMYVYGSISFARNTNILIAEADAIRPVSEGDTAQCWLVMLTMDFPEN